VRAAVKSVATWVCAAMTEASEDDDDVVDEEEEDNGEAAMTHV
jgi:hypothetical protein